MSRRIGSVSNPHISVQSGLDRYGYAEKQFWLVFEGTFKNAQLVLQSIRSTKPRVHFHYVQNGHKGRLECDREILIGFKTVPTLHSSIE